MSERELEILAKIAEGLSNKGIAQRLNVSPNTVKTHVANVFEKIKREAPDGRDQPGAGAWNPALSAGFRAFWVKWPKSPVCTMVWRREIGANGGPFNLRRAERCGTTILKYGLIAGGVVGSILFGTTVAFAGKHPPLAIGMVIGFSSMLLALSAVFVGIKNYRDHQLGGVIRFWPAFGMGLAISLLPA